MTRSIACTLVVVVFLLSLGATVGTAATPDDGDSGPNASSPCGVDGSLALDEERTDCLAETYSPVFHFHEAERYRPTSVREFVRRATIDGENVTLDDVAGRGDELELHSAGYTREAYPDLPRVVYANVTRTTFRGERYLAVTYWTFYFHDGKAALRDAEGRDALEEFGFVRHQADFESATVFVNESGPQWVGASQHLGGERRPWRAVRTRNDTHPHLYVAEGAHALYFENTAKYGGEIFGQNHHVEGSGAPANVLVAGGVRSVSPRHAGVLPAVYSDVTGDAARWARNGSGTDYRLERLTGEEPWQRYEGSFVGSVVRNELLGDAVPPAERLRWTDPGEWLAGLAPYETQVRAEAEWGRLDIAEGRIDGDSVVVEPRIRNVGPQPATFYARVVARTPDGAVVGNRTAPVERAAGEHPAPVGGAERIRVPLERASVGEARVTVEVYTVPPAKAASPAATIRGRACSNPLACLVD